MCSLLSRVIPVSICLYVFVENCSILQLSIVDSRALLPCGVLLLDLCTKFSSVLLYSMLLLVHGLVFQCFTWPYIECFVTEHFIVALWVSFVIICLLTLVLLDLDTSLFANSADPDQSASSEAD